MITETFTIVNQPETGQVNQNNNGQGAKDYSINDLLNEYKNPTTKDISGGAGNQSAPGQAVPGTTPASTLPDTIETRKRIIKMFWRVVDIGASVLFSLPKSMLDKKMANREEFKSSNAELDDLTLALYDYELATGKKVATSPGANLAMTIGVVYADRFYKCGKDAIDLWNVKHGAGNEVGEAGETGGKKSEVREQETENYSFEEIKKTKSGKADTRGGKRERAGRHFAWCASFKGKKCDCK